MKDINFRHLHYFWVIAREGGISRASEVLELTPQTLSGQLATLEDTLDGALFRREHRSLVLTDFGQTVFRYADAMFTTAESLSELLRQPPEHRPLSLSVGLSASIHKLIAYHLLEPAVRLDREVRLQCQTGDSQGLLTKLARRELDVVLTDRQPGADLAGGFKTYQLASSSMSLFAASALAAQLKPEFPASLDNQPFLAASLEAPYVTELMNWFAGNSVSVRVAAEVDDSALIKVFGRQGLGYFAAPTAIRDEVCRQYQVEHVASINEVRDNLYAVTRTNGASHPAIQALIEPRAGLNE
ncbi:LysR family transcriptional regulator, transcriptional activator of nhaA [Marinobacter daqiaonensis]|uniref:LysR family transcriptional regulator, transcriptional activator of nhaA n=1 Tax=Marinobacter daqiaonensis TaxID=650891 RepID=A0A1I6GMV8_9GAMM|nr:LysR substrate-binding domain-containing protein [Marinobacter daqiaonensis]SFR43530.1 LysR family transcriptional regulator, transcriptional activator of nhaA [Marinobacter daqiaonensis]